MKPNQFHIKLYQVCEVVLGYILGFKVKKGKGQAMDNCGTLDPQCSRMIKLVIGLLEQLNLFNKGYSIYFDNYYSSIELLEVTFQNKKCIPLVLPEAIIKDFHWQPKKLN